MGPSAAIPVPAGLLIGWEGRELSVERSRFYGSADKSASQLFSGPAGRLMDCGREGLEPSVGPFQSSGGAARSISCRVPMPAGLFTDHGWDGSPATGPFRLYRLFGRLTSRGSQIMAGSGCGPFQAAQWDQVLYAYYPMHGWAGLLPCPLCMVLVTGQAEKGGS